MPSSNSGTQVWPELPLEAWADTYATLHMWTQIVGKIRLTQSPWVNHSWHVTLYVTPRGLTTGPVPFHNRTFEINFDFIAHQIIIQASDGTSGGFPLQHVSVAAFYKRLMNEMDRLGMPLHIRTKPSEVVDGIPFEQDETHKTYDREFVNRFWRILVQSDRIFRQFRGHFVGKCSPIHFFWGAADLAVTRFSGRRAPEHPGGIPNLPDKITREAYSHEVSSCGFWPGGGAIAYPAFYSYAYPEPPGFSDVRVEPDGAFYSKDFREFILPYDCIARSNSPDERLLEFLQTTYEAAANLGKWDRSALERQEPARFA
jgi:hypothetical protein